MTRSRGILRPRVYWSGEQDAILRRLYPDTPTAMIAKQLSREVGSVYRRASKLGLVKSAAYLSTAAAGRLSSQSAQGVNFRFKPGQTPHNKGLRRPGWHSGRMRETQFKKGQMHGQAQRNWKPIGSERISKDGYLERKVSDEDYSHLPADEANRKRQRRWVAVHRLVWEEANGPIPAGHKLAFRNGNKRDIQLDNLECVSDAEWMRRNTVHNLPKPVARAVQLLGALNRQIRKRTHA